MVSIPLFRAGPELSKQFPDSKLIPYSELDGGTRGIINVIRQQMILSAGGVGVYPTLAKIGFIKPPGMAGIPLVGCMSVHIFITKFCQQLLLKRLKTGRIETGFPFLELRKKYSHLIVDTKGNILLVNEPRKGFLKRYVSNFYLARAKIQEPKLRKSKPFQLMRKAQRRFWPRRTLKI